MKQQLEDRLKALRAEYSAGQETLAALEAEQARVERTLLRISGAIQVLEELLSEPPEADGKRRGARRGAAAQSDTDSEGPAHEDGDATEPSDGDDRLSNAGPAASAA